MLAKALAKECDACFILLKSSTILRWALGGRVGAGGLLAHLMLTPALVLAAAPHSARPCPLS